MNRFKLFLHKYLPRLFYKKFDGGEKSGVTGYFLIEWKCLFSIGLLHFKDGSRENFHSHAFNALSWFVRGWVTEEKLGGEKKDFYSSFWPKFTPRTNCHRVISHGNTWCFTMRGPWKDTWSEFTPNGEEIVLTHGRKAV